MYEHIAEDLLTFIEKSPSVFHVTSNLQKMLADAGFEKLTEADPWQIVPGGKYFVSRNGSALLAFTVPSEGFECMHIAAAHSDSPTFRIKYNPEIQRAGHYIMLNVEKYGGAILSPWLDRPLSAAGRVIVRTESGLESRLVHIDRDLCLIPNMAIHMNREINNGYVYKVQTDMLPLFGDEKDAGRFRELIAEAAGCAPDDIVDDDLFLYSRVPGSIWGADRQFMSSGRLDDLQCAYTAVRALAESAPCSQALSIAAVFDNEEVGSRTKQGADATFLTDTLERIRELLGLNAQQFHMAAARSFMISADNAHAVHPMHTEKADPVNRPAMNGGPVIKFSANQKYTTDGQSAAVFREICHRAGVPCQVFYNHSDQAGGSTLGNLSNGHLALPTVDIGMAQLAMHSPYETAGVKDTEYLARVFHRFYEDSISLMM